MWPILKKYFVTGVVILFPLALTLAIALFVIDFLTQPFTGFAEAIFGHYFVNDLNISNPHIQHILSVIAVLFFLVAFTVSLGALARWVFFHYFLRFGEYILNRIPIIGTIYKTSQDVIRTLFNEQAQPFKKVVMLPFPHAEVYSLGFVTQEDLSSFGEEDRVAVFIPTTPNPTSGFLIMVKKIDLVFLEMKVEDALKYIISCGVITAPVEVQETALAGYRELL